MEESIDNDEPVLPVNPIEEKDLKIATLENELKKAEAKDLEISKLKEDLINSKE